MWLFLVSCDVTTVVSRFLKQWERVWYNSKSVQLPYMWQFRVEIEHYSVVYFDRIAAFKAL